MASDIPCIIDEGYRDQPDKLLLSGGFSEHFGLRYRNSLTGLHNAATRFYRISIS